METKSTSSSNTRRNFHRRYGRTVNPSLTDIKRITIKLQNSGEKVEDVHVYKWFHNRKFRLKHKLRDAKQNRQELKN